MVFAQVGIGTSTPEASAKLEVKSTTQGFLPPRMTTAERNAIATPVAGLMIINTTSGCINIYSGTSWRELCPTDVSGKINSLNTGGVSNSGTLVWGIAASGVSSSLPYTGGNGEPHSGQTVSSTGVTGLTAILSAGTFAIGSGTLTYTISGTPASSGTASFGMSIGGQNGTLTRTVNLPPASVTTLDCASATNNGSLAAGNVAIGVSSSVPYTGGNGGTYDAQTISSTGVTGLTATLSAGTIAVGANSLTFVISGTPVSSGTASFALNLGGQSCTLTRTVDPPQPVYCSAGTASSSASATTTVDISSLTSPSRQWMDRNLGASQVATSTTDVDAFGDYYQWGRRSDGHQCRNSGTTTTVSSIDEPPHGDFILESENWRSPTNDNLWQGVNGVNNPCPSGYRLPTAAEWTANNWANGSAAFSQLKLSFTGYRASNSGSLSQRTFNGNYWTSTISGTNVYIYAIGSSDQQLQVVSRANGYSVRCIKD